MCDAQQQRILTLFGNGSIDESAVTDKLSQLNKEKQELEEQVNRLFKSMEQQIDINTATKKIEQYCKKVKQSWINIPFRKRKKH